MLRRNRGSTKYPAYRQAGMTKFLNFKQKYFDQLDIGIYLEFVICNLGFTNHEYDVGML